MRDYASMMPLTSGLSIASSAIMPAMDQSIGRSVSLLWRKWQKWQKKLAVPLPPLPPFVPTLSLALILARTAPSALKCVTPNSVTRRCYHSLFTEMNVELWYDVYDL